MKVIQILSVFSLIFILSCNPKIKRTNHFTSKADTLVLITEKIKGYGMFAGVGGDIGFCDTSEFYKYPVIFPENITNIKFSHEIIDFKKFDYDDYHNKKSWNNTILKDNSICLMLGNKGNQSIIIVDENNNKDFRDDSIRLVQDYDWNKPAKLIKIKYKIFNGKEMAEDSSWATIRTRSNNEFIFFVSHHLESNFSIDNQLYQVGIVNFHSGFCFNDPIIALTTQNGTKKDTLAESELIKKGEYLKLKDSFYRLDTVSNDGKFVTLVKESDFRSKIGTQVGMIAPDFNCKTLEGDSIRFKDYKGKYLLLINVSACYSKESSYTCYRDLTEAYRGKLELLCIDKSPGFLNNNIKELKLTGKFINGNENKTIEAYRPEFCSRTCFLINPQGRIIDKFEIFDWKTNLSKLKVKDEKPM